METKTIDASVEVIKHWKTALSNTDRTPAQVMDDIFFQYKCVNLPPKVVYTDYDAYASAKENLSEQIHNLEKALNQPSLTKVFTAKINKKLSSLRVKLAELRYAPRIKTKPLTLPINEEILGTWEWLGRKFPDYSEVELFAEMLTLHLAYSP